MRIIRNEECKTLSASDMMYSLVISLITYIYARDDKSYIIMTARRLFFSVNILKYINSISKYYVELSILQDAHL